MLKNFVFPAYLLVFLFLLKFEHFSQPNFKSITYSNVFEMPTNLTKSIIKDDAGYIWIATDAGLVQFDGFKYKLFISEMPSRYVKSLYKLRNGNVAVITDLGILQISWNGFDHEFHPLISGGTFGTDSTIFYPKHVFEDSENVLWLSEPDAVVSYKNGNIKRYYFEEDQRTDSYFRSFLFEEDKLGNLLITSQRGSIFLFDGEKDSFKRLINFTEKNIRIDAFLINDRSEYLIGTNAGIYKLLCNPDYSDLKLQKYAPLKNISAIRNYVDGNYIIGTWTDGLFLLDQENGIHKFKDLGFDIITDIFISENDNVWITSDEGYGLVYETFFSEVDLSSSSYYIQNVSISDEGNILATDGNSVYEITFFDGKINYHNIFSKKESLILSVAGGRNNLWIGYRDGFIDHLRNNNFDRIFLPKTENVNRLVISIIKDNDGSIWASQEGLEGLVRIDNNNEISIYNGDHGIDAFVQAIAKDNDGNIFAGGRGADSYLYKYDRQKSIFQNISDPRLLNGIDDFYINDIAFDSDHNIWLGSSHGLYWLSEQGGLNKALFENDENEVHIKSLTIDENDNIWAGHEYGIIFYSKGQVTRFSLSDGLSNQTISYRSSVIEKNGKLFVGTAHGLIYQQSAAKLNRKTLKPLITDFISDYHKYSLTETDRNLDYSSNISLSFISLSYPNNKINYQWRLIGIDSTWQNNNYKRSVIIPHMESGAYQFQVRAKQTGFSWSEPASLQFSVSLPWYYSNWFLVSVAIVIAILLYGLFRHLRIVTEKRGIEEKLKSFLTLSSDLVVMLNKDGKIIYKNNSFEEAFLFQDHNYLRLVHKEDIKKCVNIIENIYNHKRGSSFEVRMRNKTNGYDYYSWNFAISKRTQIIFGVGRNITEIMDMKGKLEILNADKDRFFSIVAHDLKAPVFTLVGFSEILNDEFETLELEEIKDFSARIYNQAGRLNDLITNLLEWGRIQLGRIEYEMKTFNLYLIAVKSIHLLIQNFETKGIEVENKLDKNIIVRADENMVRSVIMNLLTNAIKFSPRNSKIIISSKTDKEFATITVQDFGVGISKSDLNKLFRIDVPHKSIGNGKEKGTGLGLIISKEFIEKNQGRIWVESESGKGTAFHFTLPLVILRTKSDQFEYLKTSN